MPAVINLATNLMLGAALPLVVRKSQALRQDFVCWQLLFLTAFEAAVFTPLATYLFRFYPQWSLLYAFDPQLYPELDRWTGMLSAAVIVLNFAAAVLGFALARWGILRNKTWAWATPLAVGAVTWAAVLALSGDRVLFIGDFDAYWQGSAGILYKRFAGWVGISLYASMGIFLLWVRRRFASHDPTLL